MHSKAPLPLHRCLLTLQQRTPGIPKSVNVTRWGTPLEEADYTVFYFGGMPSSAEEPALHSIAANESDVYRGRKIHLIAIDKPGMGLSSWNYWFQIRRDWPLMVHQVAGQLGVHDKYGVFGVSNGGPYVMACLTHPTTSQEIGAAAMIVGVSDVSASGYFSLRHLSGLGEGLYNSLPVFVTGPLNYLLLSVGSLVLFNMGGFKKATADFPHFSEHPDAAGLVRTVIADGVRNAGIGAALDCQQGLSPLYCQPVGQAANDYAKIRQPVSLWYGTKDSTVPMRTAMWLRDLLPNSVLFARDTGHGLFFFHTSAVIDDLIAKLKVKSQRASK